MRPLSEIVVALFAFSSPVLTQTARNARPLTAEPTEKWVIRWNRSDDFNGNSIDWRKWNKTPENFVAWTWDNESNVSVSDGLLTITVRRVSRTDKSSQIAETERGSSSPFTSGMLKSYATGAYGYYEARIKGASVFPGVCPAFWLYSRIDDSLIRTGDVRYCEVDIVELTQRGGNVKGNERIMDHNLHAILSNGRKGVAGRQWQRPNDKRFKGSHANEYKAPFDPREGFHTYGCLVSRDQIVWYVDGVEVGCKKNQYWHRNVNVALSLGLRAPYARFENNRLVPNETYPANDFPTSMIVDYVRVWELAE
jgi:beta-glucanase (GH16 family)